MKPQQQKICDIAKGDCFQACMASILEVPNDSNLPQSTALDWFIEWCNFLDSFGLSLGHDREAVWKEGYWIAVVPSKNFKNTSHSIVMFSQCVAFDPSTKKKYQKGINLLGKDIVKHGYWLEISDMSKLKRYLSL